jgi:hypothetical protein
MKCRAETKGFRPLCYGTSNPYDSAYVPVLKGVRMITKINILFLHRVQKSADRFSLATELVIFIGPSISLVFFIAVSMFDDNDLSY